jgi:hypothetical protein
MLDAIKLVEELPVVYIGVGRSSAAELSTSHHVSGILTMVSLHSLRGTLTTKQQKT